jgi:acylphosphatase
MSESRKAFKAIVKGRVQGVSFRYYTKQKADQLGIKGEVRNLPDGSVYVRAEASEPAITEFRNFLTRGPRMAHVEDILLEWYEDLKYDKFFEITF